jgi:hypothetical protein
MATPYKCASCGVVHDELPDIGATYPDPYFGVPEDERSVRVQLTGDTCVIDEDYFIRGVIEIPIHDYPEKFGFGVWVSQKRENFLAYRQNPESTALGPFFGWLCTKIAYFSESTWALKTRAHFREKLRPSIEMQPSDHPLSILQRDGMSLDDAWRIVHWYQDRAGNAAKD